MSKRKFAFYLAGRYQRRLEFSIYADEIRMLGYEVTSRWLTGEHNNLPLNTQAHEDKIDIMASDAVLLFTEKPGVQPNTGGRHYEAGFVEGINLGWEICNSPKHVHSILIGPKENIFYHETCGSFDNWNHFLQTLVMGKDPHANPITTAH